MCGRGLDSHVLDHEGKESVIHTIDRRAIKRRDAHLTKHGHLHRAFDNKLTVSLHGTVNLIPILLLTAVSVDQLDLGAGFESGEFTCDGEAVLRKCREGRHSATQSQ